MVCSRSLRTDSGVANATMTMEQRRITGIGANQLQSTQEMALDCLQEGMPRTDANEPNNGQANYRPHTLLQLNNVGSRCAPSSHNRPMSLIVPSSIGGGASSTHFNGYNRWFYVCSKFSIAVNNVF